MSSEDHETKGTSGTDMNQLLRELYSSRMERHRTDPSLTRSVEVCDKVYAIQEVPGLSLGSSLWAPSLHLCRHLARLPTAAMKGKRVIELGAGVGLCGIVVAKCHPTTSVVITDRRDLLELIDRNIRLNFSGRCVSETARGHMEEVPEEAPKSIELDWVHSDVAASPALSGRFDYIVASDVVYHPDLFEPLLKTILELSTLSTRILLSYKKRIHAESAFFEAISRHFEVESLHRPPKDAERDEVVIFSMKRRPHSWLLDGIP